MKQKLPYVLTALILVAVGAYLYMNSGKEATAPIAETSSTNNEIGAVPEQPANINGAAESPLTAITKNDVVLSTQTAGPEVTVDNFYFEKPGFIVIHEIKNDSPGAVIGSSGLLNTGPGQDITFKAPLKKSTFYFARMYEDNGDKKFDVSSDKILPIYNLQTKQYNQDQVVQFKAE